jgi:hypothetical protein
MRKKITIYQYIASSVPNDAYVLLNKYGKYNRAKDERELVAQLKEFVRENGSIGLMALAQIHPDKDLILQSIEEDAKKESFSNANGSSEATKTTTLPKDNQEQITMSKLMIYGSFLLIGLALVIKK